MYLKNVSSVHQIKSFPSGNLVLTAREDDNKEIISIFDNNFNLKDSCVNENSLRFLSVKNNVIFATFDKNLINIYSIIFLNNSNIQIKRMYLIEDKDKIDINNISFLKNNDILGISEYSFFHYSKTDDISYKKILNYSYEKNSIYSLITINNEKDVIISFIQEIRLYQIKNFSLKSIIKLGNYYYNRRKLLNINKNIFACICRTKADNDLIIFYDVKKMKKIFSNKLKKNILFINTFAYFEEKNILINETNEGIYINEIDKNSKNSISYIGTYHPRDFYDKMCKLNENEICIYSIFNHVDIYEFK